MFGSVFASSRSLGLALVATAAICFHAAAGFGQVLPGYSVGSGANTSYLVVDFGFIGGDAYEFAYSYDGSATGEDLLLAIEDGGSLVVDKQFFDFGGGPSIFVDGFSFAGLSESPSFEGAAGESWSYWVSDTAPTLASAWTSASVGSTDRALSDGSYDGFALNVSAFNGGGFTPTNNPPAAVPEPASIALVGLAALAVASRRRRS